VHRPNLRTPTRLPIWQVWLGGAGPPEIALNAHKTCTRAHRGSSLIEVELVTLENVKDWISELHPSFWLLDRVEQADYLRIELLHMHGGFYLDMDVICLRSLDHLVKDLNRWQVSGSRNKADYPPIRRKGKGTVFSQNAIGPISPASTVTARWHDALHKEMDRLTPQLQQCYKKYDGIIPYPNIRKAGTSLCGVKWGGLIDLINIVLWPLEESNQLGFGMSLCDQEGRPMGLPPHRGCDITHLGLANRVSAHITNISNQQPRVGVLPSVPEHTLTFISKPKCASNYIDDMLFYGKRHHTHRSGQFIEKIASEQQRFLICVRDPYELVKSWYYYHKFAPRESSLVHNFYPSTLEEWVVESNCSTHWQSDAQDFTPEEWKFQNPLLQSAWLPSDTSRLEMVRFETLEEDLEIIAKKYRIPVTRAKSNMFKNEGTKSGELSLRAKLKVQQLFARDFDMFGYEKSITCHQPTAPASATVITALWDINREIIGDSRKFTDYLAWMQATLQLNASIVVYASARTIQQIDISPLNNRNVCLISMDVTSHPYHDLFFEANKNIIGSKKFKNHMQHPNRVEMKNPEYNIINWGKIELMRMTLLDFDPFKSEYVVWVDAGLSRFMKHPLSAWQFPNQLVIDTLISTFPRVGLFISTIPEIGNVFDAWKLSAASDHVWSSRNTLAGTVLLSTSHEVKKFESIWRTTLTDALRIQEVNNDQIMLALLWHKHPELFAVIDTSGAGHWLGFHKALLGHGHGFVATQVKMSGDALTVLNMSR